MTEESSENIGVRDIIVYAGKRQRFDGTIFKDTKPRPAVVICAEEIDGDRILLAVPLNSTVKKAWRGPSVRYCINPTKGYVDYLKSLTEEELVTLLGNRHVDFMKLNNIEKISQVAVNNAFFIKNENVKKKMGEINSSDYEIIRYMFKEYVAWLNGTDEPPR